MSVHADMRQKLSLLLMVHFYRQKTSERYTMHTINIVQSFKVQSKQNKSRELFLLFAQRHLQGECLSSFLKERGVVRVIVVLEEQVLVLPGTDSTCTSTCTNCLLQVDQTRRE